MTFGHSYCRHPSVLGINTLILSRLFLTVLVKSERAIRNDPFFLWSILVDGNFTEWGAWGACSQTCGNGTQIRLRNCTNPPPAHGGLDCVGERNQSQECYTGPCPGRFRDNCYCPVQFTTGQCSAVWCGAVRCSVVWCDVESCNVRESLIMI